MERRPLPGRRAALAGVVIALAAPAIASAHIPGDPARQTVSPLPIQQAIEPTLEATPQGPCGPGSNPETGIQGRVPRAEHISGRAKQGYTCNTEVAGSYENPTVLGTVGGFKVERYVDSAGRECAYYDTTLLFPTNIFDGQAGVNVLDMSNPAKPVLTDRLVTPAMLSPHESLVVSQQRGILAAVLGNPAFYPGVVDVYDISEDCRHQVLKSVAPVGLFGHESGLAPDGKTFYSASPGTRTLAAVDISNPSVPVPLWVGPYDSHGLSISDDGNRAYVAGTGSGLIILDTSEVQARKPNPKVREIARLQWNSMSIPQNAIPVTIDDQPYLVEIDEFGTLDEVGAARIIDIGDEARPKVISNMRLGVHQPENFDAIRNDPQAALGLQGYAGHYCNVPQRVDPGIVACSMILSGLRVFDIRDPYNPKEIAYFNAPIKDRGLLESSNWAMSSPSFAPGAVRSGTRTGSRASTTSGSRTTSGRSSAAPAGRRRSPPSSRRRRGRRAPTSSAASAARTGSRRRRHATGSAGAAATTGSPAARGATGSTAAPAATSQSPGHATGSAAAKPSSSSGQPKYSTASGGSRRLSAIPTTIVRNQVAIASEVLRNASGIERPKKTTGVSEVVRDQA